MTLNSFHFYFLFSIHFLLICLTCLTSFSSNLKDFYTLPPLKVSSACGKSCSGLAGVAEGDIASLCGVHSRYYVIPAGT